MLFRMHSGNFMFMTSGGNILTIVNESKNTKKKIELPGVPKVLDFYGSCVFVHCQCEEEIQIVEFKYVSGFRLAVYKYMEGSKSKKSKEILNFK